MHFQLVLSAISFAAAMANSPRKAVKKQSDDKPNKTDFDVNG
jgi:hypothetical protein